ncbi:MAG TPA: FG-GAP-like repeat-containing protein [Novosphingobium sp.]|nr:FG-GAP-like repeat-containing protein [Novosphingobium sp.]
MANFTVTAETSGYGFSISSLNFNWFSQNAYNSGAVTNANVSFEGTVYPDQIFYDARGSGIDHQIEFLGTGITGNLTTGITGGTIQAIAEQDNNGNVLLAYASGLSLSAVELYNAILTPSNTDDINVFASGFSGNDTITLSNGTDYMGGFSGDDTIYGMGGNDYLFGGPGNDSIDGGSGIDRAIYSVSRSQATITHDPVSHTLTVSAGADGTDTLQRVEQLSFSDGLYSFLFTNPGTPVVANFNPANGWTSQDQFPRHLADVNGDGYMDIVGFGYSGMLVSYGSASGKFSGAGLVISDFGQTKGWSTDNQFHRTLADVNGDGRADIVGFGYAGTLVSLAKPDGTYTSPSVGIADFGPNQGWASQNGYARAVADVNGDGKADIVGFGTAGTWVSLGNGDGTFQPVKLGIANFGVNQGWTSDNTYHRVLADVNGDGKADIVGFGIAGTWVALSNGDGTFADAQLALFNFGANQGWSNNDTYNRVVTDVNHDGLADIVGFGIAGTYVAFGNGNGFFSDPSLDVANFNPAQGWTSDNTYHREVSDMNHDGLADVVGFGIAGVLVGQNQGDFLI